MVPLLNCLGNIAFMLLTQSLLSDREVLTVKSRRWATWLATAAPWDVMKVDVQIESVFKSHSTLVLVSIPTTGWNLLAERPAYKFIGFIRSQNLVQTTVDSRAKSLAKPTPSDEIRSSCEDQEALERPFSNPFRSTTPHANNTTIDADERPQTRLASRVPRARQSVGLNDVISKSWPPESDELLIRARQQGLSWNPIATQYFPGKTANACRKRHERLMEKRNNSNDWYSSKELPLSHPYTVITDNSFGDSALGLEEDYAPGSDTERVETYAASTRNEQSSQRKSAKSDYGVGQSTNVGDGFGESHPWLFPPRYSLEEKENPNPQYSAKPASVPAPEKGRNNTPWSPAEEQRLKTVREAGNTWADIAKTFPKRTEGSLKKHWYKDMHYAEFAEDDTAALAVAIEDYKASMWKVIGQQVGKPAKACQQYAKERWGGE